MTKEEAMQKKMRELELIKQRNQIMAVVIFAAAVLNGVRCTNSG